MSLIPTVFISIISTMVFSWGRLINKPTYYSHEKLCAFNLFLPLRLIIAIASKDNRRVLKNKHRKIKVCCLEELILTERWPLSLHTHSFILFYFIFLSSLSKGTHRMQGSMKRKRRALSLSPPSRKWQSNRTL